MNLGRDAFNRGEFYEAHEFWEEVWNEIDNPERRFVQGMIQIATGLHKLTRDRPDVCRTLLEKALTKLEGAPDTLFGFDLAQLQKDASEVLQKIALRQPAIAQTVRVWTPSK